MYVPSTALDDKFNSLLQLTVLAMQACSLSLYYASGFRQLFLNQTITPAANRRTRVTDTLPRR